MEIIVPWRLTGLMNLILILAGLINIQGKESYLCEFLPKTHIGLYLDIYGLIFFFDLGLMIETTKFYILIPVWITLTFNQGHICMRNE